MKLTVNGKQIDSKARTLADLCTELGYGEMRIATARNAGFVPENRRADIRLKENDQIEIVAPRQGG